jgi:GH24 family phage-related lysozyme (muramidase)
MAPIDLRSAAAHHRDLPHQNAAWQYLQEQVPESVLAEFAVIFRAGPPEALPSAPHCGDAVELVLPMIRYFEGFSDIAYVDPLSGGEPITIGFGTTVFPCGRPVRMGDRVSREQAEDYLRWYANRCEEVQRSRIPTWGQMGPHQQAALIGFAFNLGANWFGSHGFATLTRVVREADWGAVPDALLLYRNPGSSVEAGLRRRRQAEGDLFRSGAWFRSG